MRSEKMIKARSQGLEQAKKFGIYLIEMENLQAFSKHMIARKEECFRKMSVYMGHGQQAEDRGRVASRF